jgi:DNA-binding protein HU-beta
MTQNELIEEIARQTGYASRVVKDVILGLGDVVCATVSDNGEVILPRIGKIKVKLRPARKGRNLQTGAEVVYPAKFVPNFVVAKALKDAAAIVVEHLV